MRSPIDAYLRLQDQQDRDAYPLDHTSSSAALVQRPGPRRPLPAIPTDGELAEVEHARRVRAAVLGAGQVIADAAYQHEELRPSDPGTERILVRFRDAAAAGLEERIKRVARGEELSGEHVQWTVRRDSSR
jgi:hypothetical protein